MPYNTAKTAFNKAQRIAAEMRDVQAKEELLNESLKEIAGQLSRATIENEIIRLCALWNRLHREYTATFADYVAAVEAARRE